MQPKRGAIYTRVSTNEQHGGMQKILMCCDARLHMIVIALLDTGMRVGIEALRLKWSDIDFDESIITVVQSGTAAGLRALPMTAFVRSEPQK